MQGILSTFQSFFHGANSFHEQWSVEAIGCADDPGCAAILYFFRRPQVGPGCAPSEHLWKASWAIVEQSLGGASRVSDAISLAPTGDGNPGVTPKDGLEPPESPRQRYGVLHIRKTPAERPERGPASAGWYDHHREAMDASINLVGPNQTQSTDEGIAEERESSISPKSSGNLVVPSINYGPSDSMPDAMISRNEETARLGDEERL